MLKLQKNSKRIIAVIMAILLPTILFSQPTSAKTTSFKNYKVANNKDFLELADYDYSSDVKKSEAQGLSYFNDAVFLGDSRAVDLVIYSDLSKTKALPYCDIGLSVTSVFTKDFVSYDGVKVDAFNAMTRYKSKFSKVYLMFGVNELGYDSAESFIKQYVKVVNKVRSINKNAVIYVHSILPVSKQKSMSTNIYTNQKIKKFNKYIKEMCKKYKLFYIDAYEEFANNEGYLPYGAASDGVHFNSEYSGKWLTFLGTHTVN